MDLEATALIIKPTKHRTIAERSKAYGYKRLAFDLLIFVIKLAVLIGLAELLAYGMYKNPENILKNPPNADYYVYYSIHDEILRSSFQMRLYLEFRWRSLQMQYS